MSFQRSTITFDDVPMPKATRPGAASASDATHWASVAGPRVNDGTNTAIIPDPRNDEHMMIAGGSNTIQFGEEDLNKPPTIAIAPIPSAAAGSPVVLVANVSDDGLPKPRPPAAPRPAAPTTPDGRFQSQRNSSAPRPSLGLRVIWIEYRGPAKASFEINPVPVTDGKAVTNVRFAAPGTYTLVGTANDGRLSARAEMIVNVK